MTKLNLETKFIEKLNEEKQGIELYFESFPTLQDRNTMKENGYRWNAAKKCWYVKASAEGQKTTKKENKKEVKTLNLKTLTKIEDFDEFMNIWNINHKNRYWGNKKISLEQEQEIIKKHDVEDFKRYVLYKTSDGYIIKFDTKPSITKTLYYDDETEDPGTGFEIFKHYNKMNFEYDLTDWEKEFNSLKTVGCCSGSIELKPFININFENSKEVYPVFYKYFGNSRRDKNTVRELTEDEIQDYLTITKQLKEDYNNRLLAYYNKYSKNIHTCGYWANR